MPKGKASPLLPLLLSLFRLMVGGVFLFSGLLKGIDPVGTALKIQEYITSFGGSLPELWAQVLAVALCLFEALLGYALLVRLFPKVSYGLLVVTMLGMTALTFYIYLANPVADCGCFGEVIKLSNLETFLKNLLLLPISLFLFRFDQDKGTFSLLSQMLLILLADGLFLWFFTASIRHLPPIDFLPFKVGVDLKSTDKLPEKEDSFKYIFAKDGMERSFTIDELADVDSTWVYIREEIEGDQEGTISLSTSDFRLFSSYGNDVTDSLLGASEPILLLFATKEYAAHFIESIPDLAQRFPSGLYFVHTSESYEVPEPFTLLWADPSLSRTVLRTTTGALVLDRGVIVHKMSGADFLSWLEPQDQGVGDLVRRESPKPSRRLAFLLGGLLLLFLLPTYWRLTSSRSKENTNRY